jgi:hypothetical protein
MSEGSVRHFLNFLDPDILLTNPILERISTDDLMDQLSTASSLLVMIQEDPLRSLHNLYKRLCLPLDDLAFLQDIDKYQISNASPSDLLIAQAGTHLVQLKGTIYEYFYSLIFDTDQSVVKKFLADARSSRIALARRCSVMQQTETKGCFGIYLSLDELKAQLRNLSKPKNLGIFFFLFFSQSIARSVAFIADEIVVSFAD